jgi:hypothetical protein
VYGTRFSSPEEGCNLQCVRQNNEGCELAGSEAGGVEQRQEELRCQPTYRRIMLFILHII